MRVEIATATENQLDWMMAAVIGVPLDNGLTDDERYTTNWEQCGPLLAQYNIGIMPQIGTPKRPRRCAYRVLDAAKYYSYGDTLQIAIVRCIVTGRFGSYGEVPDGLA